MNQFELIIENEKYKEMINEYHIMIKKLLKEIDKRDLLIKELQKESKKRAEKILELYYLLTETNRQLNLFKKINPS